MEVKIKGVKQLEANLLKYLEDIKTDEDILKTIGDKSVHFIVASTQARSGEYVRYDVKKSWAERRAELATSNPHSEFYQGSIAATRRARKAGGADQKGYLHGKFSKTATARANLTLTGQLLASLTYVIEKTGIKMLFEGVHTPYKSPTGKTVGKAVANQVIADGNAKNRGILFLSDNIKKQLETVLVREVRRKISLYQRLRKKVGGVSDD